MFHTDIIITVFIFFLLKAKVCNGGESTSGTEESSMEAPTLQPQPITTPANSTSKKISRNRKNERKKKTEDEKILSPSHAAGHQQGGNQSQGLDMGYLSGGSQCTPGMVAIGTTGNPPVGHTPLSGYNSSGYDTEYPSLPEDHGIPALINGRSDPFLENHGGGGKMSIKTEHFSPQSQNSLDNLPYGLPPPYKPCYLPNRPNKYQPISTNLQTLPEIIGPTGGAAMMDRSGGHTSGGFLRNNRTIHPQETFSSGYSSFDGSPIRASDEVSSISGSSSGYHQNFRNSDLSSSSHSSYSTLSSRLSSPTSSYRRNNFDNGMKLPEYNTLKSFHQQMGDFKHAPYFSRQHSSDEVNSIRSSHSSKFSSSVSEFSDDFHHQPHPSLHDIHTNEFSPRQPLPPIVGSQSQSMPVQPFEQSQYLPPASSISNLQSPESYTDSSMSGGGGSIPLQHMGMMSPLQKAPPLPMVMDTTLVRSESPNLMVGNMSSFSSQLQQESLLFETLVSNSGPPPSLIQLNIN